MATVALVNTTLEAIVSPEDADFLRRWNWSLNGRYVSRGIRRNGRYSRVMMHRVVARRGGQRITGKEIDHINRNPLDNRRRNLRAVSKSANQHKSGARRDSSTGCRGITRRTGRDTLIVRIQVDKKREYIGDYLTLDAALAARTAAEERLLNGKA
jgi:hypothetical protein